ncbi:MAG: PL29 family lyase N-terminal domain-containing protein [Flavobacteriales bacterium]|nr:PL29 family lyase N-terminal domain-containing protein [Flavobacteriales bacterium]
MRRNILKTICLASIGALTLAVSSCAKNYDGDIERLEAGIEANKTALENALKSGKLITAVNAVTNGWDIVFSDGSKITVNNGKDGANGTAGKDAFAPVLGIDAQGYWTVVTEKGATPVRIKDVNGKECKAVASVPTPNAETKTWWIDGTDTKVPCVGDKGQDAYSPYIDVASHHWMVYDDATEQYVDTGIKADYSPSQVEIKAGVLYIDGVATNATNIPNVVYNELTKTVIVTIYDADGKGTSYELMQAMDVMVMLTSVAPAAAENAITLNYGTIGSTFQFPWSVDKIKYTKGQVLLPNGQSTIIMPIVVSPAGASLKDCELSLVNANEESIIPIKSVTKGYDADKYGFVMSNTKSVATNAMWSVELGLTSENIKAAGDAKHLSLKVVVNKGTDSERILYTPYVYSLNGNAISAKPIVAQDALVAIGEKYDLYPSYEDMYKFIIIPASDKDKINVEANVISTTENAATLAALEGKTVAHEIKALDYVGDTLAKNVNVKFYTSLGLSNVTLPAINKVYNQNNAKYSSFADVYTSLAFKKDLWIANAKDFKVVVKDAKGNVVVAKTAVPANVAGFDIKFTKDQKATAVASNADINYVSIIPDSTQVTVGSYTATISYVDARNASYKTFEVSVPINITNKAIDFNTEFVRVPALFDGDKAYVYGDMNAQNKVQEVAPTTYNLNALYSKLPASNLYVYKHNTAAAGAPEKWEVMSENYDVTEANMYKAEEVRIYYRHFGNVANESLAQTIIITPKSSVKEGELKAIAGKSFEITHGTSVTPIDVKNFYTFVDHLKQNTKAFDGVASRDKKIKVLTIETPDANAPLVKVSESAGVFTIVTTDKVAELQGDSANVAVRITIKDLFGQVYTKDVTLVVKKAK